MERIVKIESRPHFKLYVVFEDGVEGEVDLSQRLTGPVFEPLRREDFFAKVTLDDFGAPCWPNGADWAPDALYREILGQRESSPSPGTG